MAEIVRILRDEKFNGVLVPDHVPELACPSPWHAGNAHAIGFMRALTMNAEALGPARTTNTTPLSLSSPGPKARSPAIMTLEPQS